MHFLKHSSTRRIFVHKRIWLPIFISVLFFLVISAGLNYYLFQKSWQYYLALNSTRLDPLGLSAYPTARDAQSGNHRVIVFFGDSRAASWTVSDEMAHDFVILNRGTGAQTTSQLAGRFEAHVMSLEPDILIFQAGINDLKTIPLFPSERDRIVAQCKANIETMVKTAEQAEIHVVLTTIFPLGQIPIERRLFWSEDVAIAIDEVNLFIRSLESDHVSILETALYLANDKDIVDSRYRYDFLHINDLGYEALNNGLIPIILESRR
jgi:lysophospholipase L1-like esterase